MPTSSAIGIVMPSACGTSVASTRTTTSQEAPSAISASPYCRIGGISSAKVSSSSASPNGAMQLAQHITVENPQHSGSIRRYHNDLRRHSLAHAPAVLRRSRHGRARAAVGTHARAEGLLRDGRADARVSADEADVQPGAVAARAARGVRRRTRARLAPRARPQAGGRADRHRSRDHARRSFFTRRAGG